MPPFSGVGSSAPHAFCATAFPRDVVQTTSTFRSSAVQVICLSRYDIAWECCCAKRVRRAGSDSWKWRHHMDLTFEFRQYRVLHLVQPIWRPYTGEIVVRLLASFRHFLARLMKSESSKRFSTIILSCYFVTASCLYYSVPILLLRLFFVLCKGCPKAK